MLDERRLYHRRAISPALQLPYELNLDVPWVWDIVLFTFEFWHEINPAKLYDPKAEVFVPPTAAVVHKKEVLAVQRIPGESRKQWADRVRKVLQKTLQDEEQACDGGKEFEVAGCRAWREVAG
jgi:hypothetical protein